MDQSKRIKLWECALVVLIVGAAAFFCFGCVTVPVAPLPDGTPSGETALVPGWSSETAEAVAGGLLDFIPGGELGKGIVAAGLALLFPKVRDNLVTAVAPGTPPAQRGKALAAAVVPYFNSPQATRKRQAAREAKKET